MELPFNYHFLIRSCVILFAMDFRNIKREFCFNVVFNRLSKKWPVMEFQRRLNTLLMVKYFPGNALLIQNKLARWQRKTRSELLVEDLMFLVAAGLVIKSDKGHYSITPLGLTCLSDYDHALRIVRIDR